MFEKVLSQNAKESLALLGKTKFFKKIYLAGGTALALQFGHRKSDDFDFFSKEKFDPKNLAKKLSKQFSGFKLEKTSWGTVTGSLNKTRMAIFFYDYPLIYRPKKFLGINIADPRDIAAMKIAAISDRGTKKDFIDLFFLIKNKTVTLRGCLNLYDKKFKKLQQNKIHILKSLAYFLDAEDEKMPKMFEKINWPEVKKFLEKEVRELGKQIIKK